MSAKELMFLSLNRFLSMTILVADTVSFISYYNITYVVCGTKNTKGNPVHSNTIDVHQHRMKTWLSFVGTFLIFAITTTPLVVTYLINRNTPLKLQLSWDLRGSTKILRGRLIHFLGWRKFYLKMLSRQIFSCCIVVKVRRFRRYYVFNNALNTVFLYSIKTH